jgi:hypothetical protein
MSFHTFLYIFWICFFGVLFYIYFYYPEIFYQMIHSFKGPGGPNVNVP